MTEAKISQPIEVQASAPANIAIVPKADGNLRRRLRRVSGFGFLGRQVTPVDTSTTLPDAPVMQTGISPVPSADLEPYVDRAELSLPRKRRPSRKKAEPEKDPRGFPYDFSYEAYVAKRLKDAAERNGRNS